MGMRIQNQQTTVPVRQLTSEEVRRYFVATRTPRKTMIIGGIAFIGLLLFLLGFAINIPVMVIIGAVLFLVPLAGMFMLRKPVPGDEEYDGWMNEKAAEIRRRAFRDLQINRAELKGPPLLIRSFVLPGAPLASKQPENTVLFKKGKDGQYRFSVIFFTYLFPGTRYIAIYTQYVNAVDMSSHLWQNEEYASHHIVRPIVRTTQEEILIEKEWCRCDIKQVCLAIANQEMIPLGAYLAMKPVDRDDLPVMALQGSYVQEIEMSIRRLLRQY